MVTLRDDPPVSERLLRLLDPDSGTAEDKYRTLLEKLVKFFEWRGASASDDLAQETLKRGLEKISKGADVYAADPAGYFYGVAKKVLLEHWKRKPCDLTIDPDTLESPRPEQARVDRDILIAQVLSTMDTEERELIVRYYSGDGRRLLKELDVDANNLRVRVHRIVKKVRQRLKLGL